MQRKARIPRTIGTQSSSRVVGRSVAGLSGAPLAPGGRTPGFVPSAEIAAGLPGAMVDSSTSNRSTTKRTGAKGSTMTGWPDAPGEVLGGDDRSGDAEATTLGTALAPTVGPGDAFG